MFKINKTALLLIGSSLISLPLICDAKTTRKSAADKPPAERLPPKPMATDLKGTWSWGIGIESIKFDSKKAAAEGIGDSSTAAAFEAEYFIQNNFTTTIGFSFLPYSDHEDFSVRTRIQGTSVTETSKSKADAMSLYGELGYKKFFPTTVPLFATVRLGASTLIGSDRSISNCSNCPSENIDINGGVYTRAGVGARFGNTWALGLDFKNYFSGDIKSSVGLNIIWNSDF